jgi:hypothetical protein
MPAVSVPVGRTVNIIPVSNIRILSHKSCLSKKHFNLFPVTLPVSYSYYGFVRSLLFSPQLQSDPV